MSLDLKFHVGSEPSLSIWAGNDNFSLKYTFNFRFTFSLVFISSWLLQKRQTIVEENGRFQNQWEEDVY